MTRNAAETRNLRHKSVEGSVTEQTEELPEWPGQGTSGQAKLRNLRHNSVEGSAIGWRIQASGQLKP